MDDDQDYELRKASGDGCSQEEEQRIQAEKEAEWRKKIEFSHFWDAIGEAFRLGHHAPREFQGQRNCTHCGKGFNPTHGNQTLCQQCQALPFQRVNPPHVQGSDDYSKIQRKCRYCGEVFTIKSGNQKTCEKCQQARLLKAAAILSK